MKMINKLSAIFFCTALLFTQPAAASTSDSRYIFDELEEVDDFLSWNISGWQGLDSRSLIVDIAPGKSYLLILDRRVNGLRSGENISISSVNSRVTSGIDRVQFLDIYSRPTRIGKIYLLPDRATRKSTSEQIRTR